MHAANVMRHNEQAMHEDSNLDSQTETAQHDRSQQPAMQQNCLAGYRIGLKLLPVGQGIQLALIYIDVRL